MAPPTICMKNLFEAHSSEAVNILYQSLWFLRFGPRTRGQVREAHRSAKQSLKKLTYENNLKKQIYIKFKLKIEYIYIYLQQNFK